MFGPTQETNHLSAVNVAKGFQEEVVGDFTCGFTRVKDQWSAISVIKDSCIMPEKAITNVFQNLKYEL